MIRLLLVFAFALFTNSVEAGMSVKQEKKNQIQLEQISFSVDAVLFADDSGDDDFELLKKNSSLSLTVFQPFIFRPHVFAHVACNTHVDNTRTLLSRICVLRL